MLNKLLDKTFYVGSGINWGFSKVDFYYLIKKIHGMIYLET